MHPDVLDSNLDTTMKRSIDLCIDVLSLDNGPIWTEACRD
jgi:hypothetical protein